jgi:hypothetical protein
VVVFNPASTRVNLYLRPSPSLSLSLSLESYVTTDGQSAIVSWNKAHNWGLRPNFYYCLTVAGLLIWGALSDERTGLSSSAVIFWAESRRTRCHVLLSQIRDFLFVASYDSQGHGGGIRPRLHTGLPIPSVV